MRDQEWRRRYYLRNRSASQAVRDFFNAILCAAGFHDWRERGNGKATERVCMRGDCPAREKLYGEKDDGRARLWNPKKIPVRGHSFEKVKR